MHSEVAALPTPKLFTQTAIGSFTARVKPGTPHCGPTKANHPVALQYQYTIELKYHGKALDVQGFLVDNSYFQQYFEALQNALISISCENLSRMVARDLLKELGDRACHCESVTVGIGGVPGVMTTATYHPAFVE